MKKMFFIVCSVLLNISTVNAQVQFEGTASYKITGTSSRLNAKASVTKVANYNNYMVYGAHVILGLTKGKYAAGKSLNGTTIASSSSNDLQPRTIYQNVNLSGTSSIRSNGNYNIVLLLLDNSSTILTGLNFKKTIKVGNSNSWRRTLKHSFEKTLMSARPEIRNQNNNYPGSYWQEHSDSVGVQPR